MMEAKDGEDFVETGLRVEQFDHLDKEHDDEIPYSFEKQIDVLVDNIQFYATLLLE